MFSFTRFGGLFFQWEVINNHHPRSRVYVYSITIWIYFRFIVFTPFNENIFQSSFSSFFAFFSSYLPFFFSLLLSSFLFSSFLSTTFILILQFLSSLLSLSFHLYLSFKPPTIQNLNISLLLICSSPFSTTLTLILQFPSSLLYLSLSLLTYISRSNLRQFKYSSGWLRAKMGWWRRSCSFLMWCRLELRTNLRFYRFDFDCFFCSFDSITVASLWTRPTPVPENQSLELS